MNERRTEFVACRLTPSELAALRDVADERSCGVGSVLRWAVRTALLEGESGGRQERGGERAEVVQTGGAAPHAIQS